MKTATQLAEEGWIRWSERQPENPATVIRLFHPGWGEPITTTNCVCRPCSSTRDLWWKLTGVGRNQLGL